MTKEEIIEMAKLANFEEHQAKFDTRFEPFARLVAEKEREACAKLVEDSWMAFSRTPNRRLDITPFPELEYVAKVIRARGQS